MRYLCTVIEAYKNKKLAMNKIFFITSISLLIVNKFYEDKKKTLKNQFKYILLICFNFEIFKLIKLEKVINLNPYTKYTILLSLITSFINKKDIFYVNSIATLSLFLLKNIYVN